MDQRTRRLYRFEESEDRIRIYNPFISMPKEGLKIVENDITIKFKTDNVILMLWKRLHQIHMVVW